MNDDEAECVRHAAELHDVGKVAIPDAILTKPGPLDPHEWEFIRRHTLIGERIVSAAPALGQVARLVRSSPRALGRHRLPGPPGRAGDPAGRARGQRDRRVRRDDLRAALLAGGRAGGWRSSELRRCASTQFDPVVVEAFCAAWAERQGETTTDTRRDVAPL